MKLSILVLNPGQTPVVKGPFLDNAAGFKAQLEGVKELRRLNPDATIIPLTVRACGRNRKRIFS